VFLESTGSILWEPDTVAEGGLDTGDVVETATKIDISP